MIAGCGIRLLLLYWIHEAMDWTRLLLLVAVLFAACSAGGNDGQRILSIHRTTLTAMLAGVHGPAAKPMKSALNRRVMTGDANSQSRHRTASRYALRHLTAGWRRVHLTRLITSTALLVGVSTPDATQTKSALSLRVRDGDAWASHKLHRC